MTSNRGGMMLSLAALSLAAIGAAHQSPTKQPTLDSTFPAILFTPTGTQPYEFSAAYGDFTLAGPKTDALKPLPKGIRHVAYDKAGKQLYGVSNHEVYQVDLTKGEKIQLTPSDDLPRLSWTCGIAFDTKRERVVVVTLGGVGHLYSYAPKTGKWAMIAEMDNLDLAALAYDAKEDRLFGLYQRAGESSPTIGVGGELAVITEDRIFAVDLKTEKIQVTWRRK